MALLGRRDLPLSPDARDGFEMVMLRMLAFRPASLPGAPRPRLQLPAATAADAPQEADRQAQVPAAEPVVSQPVPAVQTTAPVEPVVETEIPAVTAAEKTDAPAAQTIAPEQQGADVSPVIASSESVPATEPVTDVAATMEHGADVAAPETLPAVAPAAQAAADPVEPAPWEDLPAEQPVQMAHTHAEVAVNEAMGQEQPSSVAVDSTVALEPTAPVVTPEESSVPATLAPDELVHVAPQAAPAESFGNATADAAEDDDSEDDLQAEQAALDAYISWQPESDELESLQQQQDEDGTDLKPHIPVATGLAARWIELCEQMALTGMTGNMVRHSTLVEEKDDHWTLHLDPQHSALFSASQQKRINDSINQALGRSITLQIDVEAPVCETPALSLARRRARQQADAVASIEQDAAVQTLHQ